MRLYEETVVDDAKRLTRKIVKAIEKKVPKIYTKGLNLPKALNMEEKIPKGKTLWISILLMPGTKLSSIRQAKGTTTTGLAYPKTKTPKETDVQIMIPNLKKLKNKAELTRTIYHEIVHSIDFSKFKGYKDEYTKHVKAVQKKGTPYILDTFEFNALINELKGALTGKETKVRKSFRDNWNQIDDVHFLLDMLETISQNDIPRDEGTVKKIVRRLSRENMLPTSFKGKKGKKVTIKDLEDLLSKFSEEIIKNKKAPK